MIGYEASLVAVTDNSTGSPILKAGGLTASMTETEGGGAIAMFCELRLCGDIGLIWLQK